jgi:hypothetical protein
MDGQRFDELTRLLASGTPRRRVLKGFAGGALGLFGLRVASSVRAGENMSVDPGGECNEAEECTQGSCLDGVCACEDPAEPWRGCTCDTGTEGPCGGGTLLCCPTGDTPGGPGICTSASVGCEPLGECSDPGGTCQEDGDCCEGSCSDEGVCYCEDPPRPIIGCSCTTGTESPCGDTTVLCCPTTGTPGGPGICTSDSVGCDPTGCPGVTCDPTAVLNEACECVCPLPTSPCDSGACLHCGAIFQLDPATCTCICPGTEACPCEDNTDCSGGLVCCDEGEESVCRASCEGECALPGQACLSDDDCCQGSCSDEGVCYCTDPSRPIIGCSCTTGTLNPCGDSTAVCCATSDVPGGPGICTSASVGCEPLGDECVTGTEDACPDDFECCALPGSPPGGDGICIPVGTQCARQGCQPAGTACLYDSECCAGTCHEDGFCFCADPENPAVGCACDPEVENFCGDGYVCCETDNFPECALASVGCKDDGGATPTSTVASLPSTGIGGAPDGSDGGWLAPAALAGAGAALIANRLIRRSTEAKAEATEE